MSETQRNRSLIEAQLQISENLKEITTNLKEINVTCNVHAAKAEIDHKNIVEKLQVLTDKYWWLIVVLVSAITALAGLKQFNII